MNRIWRVFDNVTNTTYETDENDVSEEKDAAELITDHTDMRYEIGYNRCNRNNRPIRCKR